MQLPYEIYQQHDNYAGNGQSALLQAVRKSLQKTYSSTDVGGDGQVVEIHFADGITFQIVPGFLNKDNSYTYPDDDRSVRRTYRVSSDRRRDDTLVAYLLEKVLRLAATRKTAMVLLMNTEVLNASFIKPEAWASINGR